MYTFYYHVCPFDNGRPLMVCKNPERENCNMIIESVSMALLLTEIKEVLYFTTLKILNRRQIMSSKGLTIHNSMSPIMLPTERATTVGKGRLFKGSLL